MNVHGDSRVEDTERGRRPRAAIHEGEVWSNGEPAGLVEVLGGFAQRPNRPTGFGQDLRHQPLKTQSIRIE